MRLSTGEMGVDDLRLSGVEEIYKWTKRSSMMIEKLLGGGLYKWVESKKED